MSQANRGTPGPCPSPGLLCFISLSHPSSPKVPRTSAAAGPSELAGPGWGAGGVASPTLEEALHAEVADAETQHRELVQLGDHVGGEGQQAGQVVQLGVEPVSVPLGGVRLLGPRGGLPAGNQRSHTGRLHLQPRPRRRRPFPSPSPATAPQERSPSKWSRPRTDLAGSRRRTHRGRLPSRQVPPSWGRGRDGGRAAGADRVSLSADARSTRSQVSESTCACTRIHTHKRTHTHTHTACSGGRPCPECRWEQPPRGLGSPHSQAIRAIPAPPAVRPAGAQGPG